MKFHGGSLLRRCDRPHLEKIMAFSAARRQRQAIWEAALLFEVVDAVQHCSSTRISMSLPPCVSASAARISPNLLFPLWNTQCRCSFGSKIACFGPGILGPLIPTTDVHC